jgi:hypothetical protein
MIWAKSLKKEIFCLEGDWDSDLTQKCTIKSILDFVSTNLRVDVIHRHCATQDNVNYYLQEFMLPKYKAYEILYFAFHGQPGSLQVGDTDVTIEDISKICQNGLRGKIVYFGSCLTMKIDKRRIDKFLRETKALAVIGYKTEVDFMDSSMLDIAIITALQSHRDMRKVEHEIKTKHPKLVKELKFRIVY